MSKELLVLPEDDLLNAHLHNDDSEQGWYFGAGDPELHHYADRLVALGGNVLDIGMGYGRNAFFFALNGMRVEGIDDNQRAVERVNQTAQLLRETMPFTLTARHADATAAALPKNAFDVVLAANMVHMPSREATLNVLDNAYNSLKVGGHLWLRLVGEEASGYEDMVDAIGSYSGVRQVGEGVFEHPCGCSGEYRLDKTVFFEQTSILTHFARKGARIVHSQLSPTHGQQNVMFGEDFRKESYVPVGGMISLLAQKTN